MRKKAFVILLLIGAALLVGSQCADAYPELQLYIQGATYDQETETWVYKLNDDSPFLLWTIGDVDAKGTIFDVKLAVAYEAGLNPTITLTPTTTEGFGGFYDLDPFSPHDPSGPRTVTDGSIPLLGDGSELPSHGIYGENTWWQEFKLGDFDQTDSPMADFIGSLPTPSTKEFGQINVYEVTVTGADWVHFDLYNHYQSVNKAGILKKDDSDHYVNAPFSHDAEGLPVPEPATLLLFGVGLIGLGGVGRRRLKKSS